MNAKSLPLGCVGAWLAISLLAGGCSGDKPQQPPVTQVMSVPQDASPVEVFAVVSETTDEVPTSAISWDVLEQRRVVNEGEGPVVFSFRMMNDSREAVVIENVTTSCGCTTFDSRAMPYSLAPGDSDTIKVSMSVTGKFGTVTKSVLVQTNCGSSTLLVTAELTPPASNISVDGLPSGAAMSSGTRGRNIGLAKADRQVIFKGDCAACHSRFAEGQIGYNLYLGACAICHDAKHRASMVPDLRTAGEEPRDAAHWRQHITDGIDGTLMPAFAKAKGGILSDEQIESLVKFLIESPLEPKAPFR